MEIIINQQVKDIPENSSVEQLLLAIMPDMQKGVAIAVNQTIIPRKEWNNTLLKPKDKIVFIKATQGG
jgi:sulfur carrier protein